MSRHHPVAFILAGTLLCAAAQAMAEPPPPHEDPALSSSDRHAVVETLSRKLQELYVFPDRADTLAKQLLARTAHGDYEGAKTASAFAAALNHDLRELGDDGHFQVTFEPGADAGGPGPGDHAVPTPQEAAEMRKDMATMSYGIPRVQRLPGNIGYLEVRGFGPTEGVGDAYDAAIHLLEGSEAIILDLRNNHGGQPESVSYLLSHFFSEGDQRHLNDIYDRPSNSTRSYWTSSFVPSRFTGPIEVLTSHGTFSGGEECAYDLQTQKRATLIGETTGGGAHPGDEVTIGHDLVAFIPKGRPINPVTHGDWEKIGVKPDVSVPAVDAMKTAYVALVEQQLSRAQDPEFKEQLQDLLSRAKAGKVELPSYTPRP